jgi:hypothetical protein
VAAKPRQRRAGVFSCAKVRLAQIVLEGIRAGRRIVLDVEADRSKRHFDLLCRVSGEHVALNGVASRVCSHQQHAVDIAAEPVLFDDVVLAVADQPDAKVAAPSGVSRPQDRGSIAAELVLVRPDPGAAGDSYAAAGKSSGADGVSRGHILRELAVGDRRDPDAAVAVVGRRHAPDRRVRRG